MFLVNNKKQAFVLFTRAIIGKGCIFTRSLLFFKNHAI